MKTREWHGIKTNKQKKTPVVTFKAAIMNPENILEYLIIIIFLFNIFFESLCIGVSTLAQQELILV